MVPITEPPTLFFGLMSEAARIDVSFMLVFGGISHATSSGTPMATRSLTMERSGHAIDSAVGLYCSAVLSRVGLVSVRLSLWLTKKGPLCELEDQLVEEPVTLVVRT